MARLAAFNPAVRSLDESVARAKLVEKHGYESLWTIQLPNARDASLVLAAYAGATQRVKLGTGVLPIYTRHPTAMVQMAATLDELSGGRFILGLGVSHKVTVEAMWGLALDKPVAAMREYLTIVRASIRDGSCSIEGEFFTARWRYSGPRRADLPIMISALNPRMLELAGELADGVVLYMCGPDYIRDEVMPALRAGRGARGREGFRGDAGGGRRRLEGCCRLVDEASRVGEPAVDPGVLGAVELLDDLAPPLFIALVQARLDLADRLGREQQPAARVVEDRQRDAELGAGPGDDLVAGMRVQRLRTPDVDSHLAPILGQARAETRRSAG